MCFPAKSLLLLLSSFLIYVFIRVLPEARKCDFFAHHSVYDALQHGLVRRYSTRPVATPFNTAWYHALYHDLRSPGTMPVASDASDRLDWGGLDMLIFFWNRLQYCSNHLCAPALMSRSSTATVLAKTDLGLATET